MIRVAAVGDIHVGEDCVGCVDLARVSQDADVLLLAGDLTRVGSPAEAAVLAAELAEVRVPVVAVLGNHDYHSDRAAEVVSILSHTGVAVLEGESAVVEVAGVRLGVAGSKGFGGGFAGACGSEFGEREMKAFVAHTRGLAEGLELQLQALQDQADVRVALLHYSPVEATLEGERLEIYPFLGSYLLGEAIDRAGADIVFHGHAHHGSEKGATPRGIPVRNVARPVIQRPYNVYILDKGASAAGAGSDERLQAVSL